MSPADALQGVFARLFDALMRRRLAVLVASAVVVVACAALAARLRVASDWVDPFLPRDDAALRAYADALRRFGASGTVYVDVAAPPGDALHAAAARVEEAMRASGLFARAPSPADDRDLLRAARAVADDLPSLLDETDLAEVARRAEPDAVADRTEEHVERLAGPAGGLHRETVERDPLGLASIVLDRVRAGSGGRLERGRLVSADGAHALLVGVAAAPVGDEEAGAALARSFRTLGDELGPGASLTWTGAHRHYAANSEAVRRDLGRVSAIAIALVLAVVFVGFRGDRIVAISAAAVGVGGLAGGAALAVASPQVSGIALGFGAALSGITVDYVIHLHAARRAGESRAAAVRRVYAEVGPTVLIGAATSAAGFLVLLASDVPAHAQIGVAAAAAIAGAVAFAMFPGPLLAAAGRDRGGAPRADRPNPVDVAATALFARILAHPRAAFAAGATLVAASAVALPSVRFESDVRRFEVRDAGIAAAQAELDRAWGAALSDEAVVVRAPDVETALARTDALTAALRPLEGREFDAVLSASLLGTSEATRARRHAAWLAFWTPDRRDAVRRALQAAAAEYGMRAGTFDPFLRSLETPPAPPPPGRFAGTPLGDLLARHLSVADGDVLSLVVLRGARRGDRAGAPAPAWPGVVRDVAPDAAPLSGARLAAAVVAATRRELAGLALPALALVFVLLLAYWRSAALALIGVLPLLGGVAVACALLVLTGERVDLLNAAVVLPVFGLGVDYAVFLVDAVRGAAAADPARRTAEVGARMGSMVGDVLTTLAGAAAMLFAATPAIRSIGIALTAGVAGTVVVAWLTVPQALAWTRRAAR